MFGSGLQTDADAVPVRGRVLRLDGGGISRLLAAVVSLLLLELGCTSGAGVCLADSSRITRRDDGGVSSGSASPLVINVNSELIPSDSYASCNGRHGREYRAVTVAFKVSACAMAALKSLTLIAT